MDDDLIRKAKAFLDSFPLAPNIDALIESGDLVKARDGHLAPTEKGRDAIARYTAALIIREGKPPVYRRSPSLRRKRKASI